VNKSKIEWLDGGYTWNPVTGCLHNCEYCYGEKIARRFGKPFTEEDNYRQDSYEGILITEYFTKTKSPFPNLFRPAFHSYRLGEPQGIKKPHNIFVCSMADLFGEWVPDEWIKQVFEACEKAPWHRYLFLTKNPERYNDIYSKMPSSNNFWFGTSKTIQDDEYIFSFRSCKTFLSIEPIHRNFDKRIYVDWVIIGAETGNRKGKVIPKREWIENIVRECRKHNVPVFMKDSLAKIWDEPLIQEYPWREK